MIWCWYFLLYSLWWIFWIFKINFRCYFITIILNVFMWVFEWLFNWYVYTHPLFRLPTQENKHTKLNTIWQDKRTGASSKLKLATNETRTNCDNAMVTSNHIITPTIFHTNKHATFGDSTLVDDLLLSAWFPLPPPWEKHLWPWPQGSQCQGQPLSNSYLRGAQSDTILSLFWLKHKAGIFPEGSLLFVLFFAFCVVIITSAFCENWSGDFHGSF